MCDPRRAGDVVQVDAPQLAWFVERQNGRLIASMKALKLRINSKKVTSIVSRNSFFCYFSEVG